MSCAHLSPDANVARRLTMRTLSLSLDQMAKQPNIRPIGSIDSSLQFLANLGPALMDQLVANGSEPNSNTNWCICSPTFSREQLSADISYVDFVSIPSSLEITTSFGGT